MKRILSLLLCLAMILTLGLTAMGHAEDGGELKVSLCIAETLGDLGFMTAPTRASNAWSRTTA